MGAGIGLVLVTVAILSLVVSNETVAPGKVGVVPAASARVIIRQVAAATSITTVPKSIVKAEYGDAYFSGESYEGARCVADFAQTTVPICTLGDVTGTHLMVLYGDSHALMWIPAFDAIAKAEHWRLVVLGKLGCPAARA